MDCHGEYASFLARYFEEGRKGWARCYLRPGAATTSNAIESFNRHGLQDEASGGSRYTIGEIILKPRDFLPARSMIKCSKKFPLTALDVRSSVHFTDQRQKRFEAWFAAVSKLKVEISSSPVHFPSYTASRIIRAVAFHAYCLSKSMPRIIIGREVLRSSRRTPLVVTHALVIYLSVLARRRRRNTNAGVGLSRAEFETTCAPPPMSTTSCRRSP